MAENLHNLAPLVKSTASAQLLEASCSLSAARHHKEVAPVHIPGVLNPADLFTKEMRDVAHFLQLRSAIMSCAADNVDNLF